MKFLYIGLFSMIGFIKIVSSTNSSTLSASTNYSTPPPPVHWNVKQCSYFNGKPYKQCNDLLGCQCSHNLTVNNVTCIQCIDACTLIRTKKECNANIHCEFNFQCKRMDLFSQTTVRFYHIEVKKEDWDSINNQSTWGDEPYVPCNFTVNYLQQNEKSFEFAMVKVKGSMGSKSSCSYFAGGTNQFVCRSLSYQINSDKNLPDNFDGEKPKIGGKDKIQFHAMNMDTSLMVERLSYSVMHHYLNITTARAVHCVLFVNGEKVGIFLNVEEIDEKSIGPILFGEKGTMYKDAWPYDYGFFDYFGPIVKEEGINLMAKLINESLHCVSENKLTMSCSPEEGRTILKKYIDTDSYTKAMIANHLLNNFDGTPKILHNHYWFRNKNGGPYIFVPWDYNNYVMTKFCKVNKDTGIIEGFGDMMNDYASVIPFEDAIGGVCAAPPFQYLPSTPEERELVCDCVPSFSKFPATFNQHMACISTVGIVASQSLANDYFKIRDDVFKNKIKIKNEVKSMVEYWSNQIRTHVSTSSITYPPKSNWEYMIGETLLYFEYGLDQLMNRKKNLKAEDIDAHFKWIKNRSKELGKCGNACQSYLDCKGCEMENMTIRYCDYQDGLCKIGSEKAIKSCPSKNIQIVEENRCQNHSDCEYEGCEMEEMTSTFCSPIISRCYAIKEQAKECEGIKDVEKHFLDYSCNNLGWKYRMCPGKKIVYSTEDPIPSSYVEKESSETSTAESKNALLGITIILILSFIL